MEQKLSWSPSVRDGNRPFCSETLSVFSRQTANSPAVLPNFCTLAGRLPQLKNFQVLLHGSIEIPVVLGIFNYVLKPSEELWWIRFNVVSDRNSLVRSKLLLSFPGQQVIIK